MEIRNFPLPCDVLSPRRRLGLLTFTKEEAISRRTKHRAAPLLSCFVAALKEPSLLVTQGDQGIDMGSAASWDVTRSEGDKPQQ